MITDNVKFIFQKGFFDSVSSEYTLIETEEKGKGELTLHCKNDENLCIPNFDKKVKISFLKHSSRVDHVVFELNENNSWDIHLIEMKTTVDNDEWSKVKNKFKGGYFAVKMIAVLLGIEIKNFYFYTTYENEKLENKATANLADLKPLAKNRPALPKTEWENCVRLQICGFDTEFKHTPIKMKRNGILYGEYSLL